MRSSLISTPNANRARKSWRFSRNISKTLKKPAKKIETAKTISGRHPVRVNLKAMNMRLKPLKHENFFFPFYLRANKKFRFLFTTIIDKFFFILISFKDKEKIQLELCNEKGKKNWNSSFVNPFWKFSSAWLQSWEMWGWEKTRWIIVIIPVDLKIRRNFVFVFFFRVGRLKQLS